MMLGVYITLGLVFSGSALAGVCGNWEAKCGSFYNGSEYQGEQYLGNIEFDGLTTGNYSWYRSVFQKSCATIPTLHIEMFGSWIDYQLNGTANERLLYLTLSAVTVLPGTDNATAFLQDKCGCGGQWQTGVPRTLTNCNFGSCGDTTWLGGTPIGTNPKQQGLIIGQPFYGTFHSPLPGTSGRMSISYLDASKTVGWSNPFPFSGNNYTGTACLSGTTTDTICGSYKAYCAPSPYEAQDSFSAMTSFFYYSGPTPEPGKIYTGDSGVFAAGEDYFLDPDCDKPFIKIRSDGVLAYTGAWSAQAGGYVIERNAPYVGVTPMMPQAVDYLTTNCPCGGTWTNGTERYLTTCPANSCNDTVIYHGGVFGQPNYQGVISKASKNFGEVQFSQLSPTLSGVPSFFTSANQPYTDFAQCQSDLALKNFCGIFHLRCSANSRYFGSYDFTELATYTGDGKGSHTRNHTVYTAGGECLQPLAYIIEVGTYEVGDASKVSKGAYNYVQTVTQLLLTPVDPSFVTLFNTNCSCGSSWAVGVQRNVIGCKTCNLEFVSPWDLGFQKAYGNVLAYPEAVRHSNLSNISTVGYNTPLDITNFPMLRTSFCIPSASKAAGFPGGGVFLILLFVPLFLYFVIGTGYNFSKSGQATIPNETFWRGLPGLITAGFRFTFVEFFGLLSSPSSGGYSQQTNKPEGYGTLGN